MSFNSKTRLLSDDVIAKYLAGTSLEDIERQLPISVGTIRKVLKANGISWTDGGAHVRKLKKIAAKKPYVEPDFFAKYGCSKEVALSIPRTARKAFLDQKRHSKRRGIVFNFILTEWWAVWVQSGKWEQRGPGHGYCMARNNDSGAYELGNIYITTGSKNMKHYQERRQNKKYDDWNDVFIPQISV
jgi:hypothetical protein